MNKKIGIDVDGTLLSHTKALKILMRIIGYDNCHLITARGLNDKDITLKQLYSSGIFSNNYNRIHFYPESYDVKDFYQNSKLYYARFIKYKIYVCKKNNIKLMIEDDIMYKDSMEKNGIEVLLVK